MLAAGADDYRLRTMFSLAWMLALWKMLIGIMWLSIYRSGDVCRKRWNQMAKHIGGRIGRRRADQVEILCEHVIVLMRLKQERLIILIKTCT